MAYCATAVDVALWPMPGTTVSKLAARWVGSYGGYSSCPGLVIDVSSLDTDGGAVRDAVGRPWCRRAAGQHCTTGARRACCFRRLVSHGGHRRIGAAEEGSASSAGLRVGLRQHRLASGDRRRFASSMLAQRPHDVSGPVAVGRQVRLGVVTSSPLHHPHPIPSVTLPWSGPGPRQRPVLDWCALIPSAPTSCGPTASWGMWPDGKGLWEGDGGSWFVGWMGGRGHVCGDELIIPPSWARRTTLRAMLIEAGCEGLAWPMPCPDTEPRWGRSPARHSPPSRTSSTPRSPAWGRRATITAVEALGTDVPSVGGAIVFDSYGSIMASGPGGYGLRAW